jgi:hypothetical protein
VTIKQGPRDRTSPLSGLVVEPEDAGGRLPPERTVLAPALTPELTGLHFVSEATKDFLVHVELFVEPVA